MQENLSHKHIDRLKEGNARFVSGNPLYPRLSAERRLDTLRDGQRPFVAILSCSDSRVPVELIFDMGIGDIFSVRNAGNVYDGTAATSFELGIYMFDIPLLIVLGHTDCGAVRAAIEGKELPGNMPTIIDRIKPVIETVKKANPDMEGEELLLESTIKHANNTVRELVRNSSFIEERVENGNLAVVAAIYHLDSGSVEWLDSEQADTLVPHSRENGNPD